MLASKPKPSLPEPSNRKEPSSSNSSSNSNSNSNSNPNANHRARATAFGPRVSRPVKPAGSSKSEVRASSSDSLHNARIPLDKSIDVPRPSSGERRSSKASTHRTTSTSTPDKQPRIAKASELQAQLNLVQEELKSAREHLDSIEKDKARVLGDLALTKSLADRAYQKLEESLVARRRAEEALELEKFKSIEREQSSIELAQSKEEEWKSKYDGINKRHAADVASLISETREELEDVRDELAATIQAKNSAITHAAEVKRIADANAEKVEVLVTEVTRLEALLDSELEKKAKEAAEIINRLQFEASELGAELQKAKAFEQKLARAEELVEGLRVDIAYAKRAEADANQLAGEWKTKAGSLEARLGEVSRLSQSNEDSLVAMTERFEDCASMLRVKKSQVLQLEEKVARLESEAGEYKEGFLETNRRLDTVRKEASELQVAIDRLRSEHELLHETHQRVVSNEKAVSTQVGVLAQDKSRLLRELDDTREERDKVKKAVEDLAAALREVSSEAREAKEKVLEKQTELDQAQFQVSELKAAAQNAQDKYQLVVDGTNYETACLRKTVERLGSEARSSKDEWVSKEAGFMDMLKRSDDGIRSIKSEVSKLMESLRVAEKQVRELKAEKTHLRSKLKEFESNNTMDASSSAEQTKVESSHLKDQLPNKEEEEEEEEEVLVLNHEVTDLRLRETADLAKANELSKLLAEATARKAEEEGAAKSTDESKALLIKLEMDQVRESLRAAEREAKAAKDDKAQLQTTLRLLESKITEANLSAEEEKIGSLRLEETLAYKEKELLSIARENDGLRTREAAAQAKIDELSSLLAEATATKGGESNGVVAVRSPNVFLKMICSPMESVRDDEPRKNSDRMVQVEEIKHVEVETVKHEKEEVSAVEANSLEKRKLVEDDLSKGRGNGHDESSDDDDVESQGDDVLVDQMNGLLIHGPTSSFNQEQHNHKKQKQKKKKALLKKFGNLLKKKAQFTRLSNHS